MKAMERYARQTMLAEIGTAGQDALGRSRVLIVGAGGLGSAAALYLAGAGVGELILCDPDTVSLSNLQRQILYSESMIDLPKSEMAAERLRALNSDITVRAIAEPFTASNGQTLVESADLVLDCTDNYATRYAIDEACAATGRAWLYASIGEFAGQLALLNGASGVRYTTLYPDRDELCGRPRVTAGVLGAVPGVIGTLQACEAVKHLTGIGSSLDGRLFTIDLLTLQTNILDI